jgi:hypothetical protein
MTDDEIKNKQEETLNNLKKYNENRKTEIVDEGTWRDAKGALQGLSDEPVEDTIRRNRTESDNEPKYEILRGPFTISDEEDPSEYTEIEVVPYSDEDNGSENKSQITDWTEEQIEEAKRYGVDLTLIVHPSVPLTDDEIRIFQETAKKFGLMPENKEELPEPITEITGNTVNPVMEKQPMQEWLDESDRLNKERGITVVPTPICEFCGNFAYQGQLHGMGYCREKIQYEQ